MRVGNKIEFHLDKSEVMDLWFRAEEMLNVDRPIPGKESRDRCFTEIRTFGSWNMQRMFDWKTKHSSIRKGIMKIVMFTGTRYLRLCYRVFLIAHRVLCL